MHLLTVIELLSCFVAAVAASKVLPLLLGCLRAKRQFLASPMPGPPLSSALIGHIPDFGPAYGKGVWRMAKWCETYGPLYKLQFLNFFAVVLTDPDTITRVTRKTGPGPYTPKPHLLYEQLEDLVSPKRPNILSSPDNSYWRAVRQATAPCFSMSNMKQVVPLAVELTKRVADRMSSCCSTQSSGGAACLFDVTDGARRITSDIMGHLLFGEDLKSTTWGPSEYLECFYYVMKSQTAKVDNPFHTMMIWRADVRNENHYTAIHNKLMGGYVTRLRKHPPEEHTIAAHILAAVDPATGQPLDDSQVKAELATFMGAGFETTSHAIAWSLALLAAHPEIQAEVLAELQSAGLAPPLGRHTGSNGGSTGGCGSNGDSSSGSNGSGCRDFEACDLGRLPLLSAVIKESLRLCAPAPFGTIRQVVTEGGAEMCGYNVPKGTVVFIPTLPYALAERNYGSTALGFNPYRWLPTAPANGHTNGSSAPAPAGPSACDAPSKKAAAGAGAGAGGGSAPEPTTFLMGPRDCIGQNLAKLELQVALATLLSRFCFSPGPDLAHELELAAATGQPRVMAVHALSAVHGTLQTASGQMVLGVTPRT